MLFHSQWVSRGILCIAIVSSQFVSFVHRHQVRTVALTSRSNGSVEPDLFSTLENYEATQRLSPIDLDYWKDEFGGDVAKMVRFVREETGLVPYRGSLRGSRGVLMDRRGNALDRSILLAEWLRMEGKAVRLCNTELTSQQAASLIPGVNAFDSANLLASQLKTVEQRHAAFAKLTNDRSIAKGTSTRSRQATESLNNAVKRAEWQFGELAKIIGDVDGTANSSADERLIALQDHWWVSVQEGQEWVELDPTYLQSKFQLVADKVVDVDPVKRTEMSLEFDLHHRIEFRVVIERWVDSKYHQSVALQKEVIASQVFDQPTVLYHIPRKWPTGVPLPHQQADLAKLGGLIEAQKEWVPVLAIGDQPVIQKAFDDEGYLLEEAKPSAFGQMGLGLARSSRAKGQLTAEWIEYEIRVPGLENRIEKRDVFDLVGADARQAARAPELDESLRDQRQMAITDSIEILPMVCNVDSQLAERIFLECLIANQGIFRGLGSKQPRTASSVREQLTGLAPMPAMVWALGVLRSEKLNQNERLFIDSPNLFTFHRRFKKLDDQKLKICAGMDIVFNQIGVLPGDKERALRMQAGVLDTNLEALMLADCSKVDNTGELFHESAKQGISWRLVENEDSLRKLKFSDDVRSKMLRSLGKGFAIVAPEKKVSYGDKQEIAWWRIDKATGETLGIGPRGWGQATTEYTVLMNSTSKRGEGVVEYLIIISLISVCAIAMFVKWVSSHVTTSVKDTLDDWEFCVDTDERKRQFPDPPTIDEEKGDDAKRDKR